MNSIENIVDDAADIAVVDEHGKIKGRDRRNTPSFLSDEDEKFTRGTDWSERGLWSEGTDAVMDVPVGGVCRVLYGGGECEYTIN